jgi:hypothetical protein
VARTDDSAQDAPQLVHLDEHMFAVVQRLIESAFVYGVIEPLLRAGLGLAESS